MKKIHPIEALIEQGEHQQLDFKFEVSDSKKIARTLSAFANTDGGRLLIGVKDNGNISGVRSEEEYYMIEAASRMYTCLLYTSFPTSRLLENSLRNIWGFLRWSTVSPETGGTPFSFIFY